MKLHLNGITTRAINSLYNDGNSDKATLAALRSCTSLLSPKASKVWPLLLSSLPKEALSKDGRPTYAEKASFAALHAYAIYQQGTEQLVSAGKNDEGKNLCQALAGLRSNDDLRTALDRRMQVLLMATNFEALTNDLFHLLKILKAHQTGILIAFGQLAQDLFYFQTSSQAKRQICLKWGQEYYQTVANSKKEKIS